ncbi:MAG: hypothetical protein PUC32_05570 [Oscillospiraceae bacterium]|nr:hypothetical protein [Oscillospiraceae bacterium]
MRERKNRTALSRVCLVQIGLCTAALLAIVVWKTIGGSVYTRASAWYQHTVSDSVIVKMEPFSSMASSDG